MWDPMCFNSSLSVDGGAVLTPRCVPERILQIHSVILLHFNPLGAPEKGCNWENGSGGWGWVGGKGVMFKFTYHSPTPGAFLRLQSAQGVVTVLKLGAISQLC
jgi:hypothetical protein